MDDRHGKTPDAASPTPDLGLALRRARVEAAERSEAIAELRGAELARLEMFGEAIKPVLAQVPDGVDLFDAGLQTGDRPRYFVDMLGFVEMSRDRRTFRFARDTRHGRVIVVESERLDEVVRAVTDYIARRLLEREMALAADAPGEAPPSRAAVATAASNAARRRFRPALVALRVLIELLGSIALALLLAAGAWIIWLALARRMGW